MSRQPNPTAALVIIGNEILSGRTEDRNLPFLARALNELGIRLWEVRVVADVEADIVKAVNESRAAYDYVFTTGGIGPTHDDITASAIAAAFDVPVERNAAAAARLRDHYPPEDLNEARLSMADMPRGAALIDNPVSRAPGFQIGNVFVLAGVPSIARAMFDGLKGRLRGGVPTLSRTVSCFLVEGQLAARLTALQARWPEIEIGSYPFFRGGRFGVSIVLRGPDQAALETAAAELRALIRDLGGVPAQGDGEGGDKSSDKGSDKGGDEGRE